MICRRRSHPHRRKTFQYKSSSVKCKLTEAPESLPPPGPQPEFEGSWERSDRSLTTAAILGLIIVGIIYAYAAGFISFIAIMLHGTGGTAGANKTFVDLLAAKAIATKNPIRYSVFISEFLFMLLPTVWIIRRWHTKDIFRYVRLRRVTGTEILLAVVAAIAFFPVSNAISNLFLRELDFPDFLTRINSEIFTSYSSKEIVWVIVVVCVTPAICEETLFRGYLQRTLERTLGAKSLFITGIIFGLFHMRPLNLVSLSLLGMMIGFFFYRSKSLLPGMAAHFTNNLMAVLSLYRLPDGKPRIPIISADLPVIGLLLAAAITVALLVLYRKETEKNFAGAVVDMVQQAP